jgi:hypothetical protein
MELKNPRPNRQKEKKSFSFKNWLYEHEWVLIAFAFVLGLLFFVWGIYLDKAGNSLGDYVKIIGGMVTVRAIFEILNKGFLREKNRKIFSTEIQKEIETFKNELNLIVNELKKEIAISVAQRMAHIQKIIGLGIVDVFEGMDLEKVLKEVNPNSTLFLQRLYFSSKEFKLVKQYILDLIINKDCIVKILLSSPTETIVLEKRSEISPPYTKALGRSVEVIAKNILLQLEEFYEILERLPEDKKKNLQIRIHNHYTIGPITGYNDTIISGLYLNDEMADDGIQEKNKGENTRAYQRWLAQFSSSWEYATPYEKENSKANHTHTSKQNCRKGRRLTEDQCIKKIA